MTGNGYSGLTLGRVTTESIGISKRKSSTLPFHISLTRRKGIGIKRSQLRKKISGRPRKPVHLAKKDGQFQVLINRLITMIEQAIPAIIAIVTGTGVLFNRVNNRVTILDNRVDRLELKLVESFTTKTEFTTAMEKMEAHLLRIENKMDKLGEALAKAEEQLADNSLYEAENKAKLNEVLALQASSKADLEEVEMEWMSAQETLEQMELEFNQ